MATVRAGGVRGEDEERWEDEGGGGRGEKSMALDYIRCVEVGGKLDTHALTRTHTHTHIYPSPLPNQPDFPKQTCSAPTP